MDNIEFIEIRMFILSYIGITKFRSHITAFTFIFLLVTSIKYLICLLKFAFESHNLIFLILKNLKTVYFLILADFVKKKK